MFLPALGTGNTAGTLICQFLITPLPWPGAPGEFPGHRPEAPPPAQESGSMPQGPGQPQELATPLSKDRRTSAQQGSHSRFSSGSSPLSGRGGKDGAQGTPGPGPPLSSSRDHRVTEPRAFRTSSSNSRKGENSAKLRCDRP